MIYFLYIASFFFIPITKMMQPHLTLLTTFSFFVSICLCIIYFKSKNTFTEALKASMLATMAFQFACLYVFQEIIFVVNKPLHALAFVCFLGVLLSLNSFTKFGIEKASITASACLLGLWGMQVMLSSGYVHFLLGSA